MTGGMATIADTVMVLYAAFLNGVIDDPISHLLTASILSAPAAIAIACLMIPADGEETGADIVPTHLYDSSMDAVTTGTFDGLRLLFDIIAMLVVLIALVYLANAVLGLLPDFGDKPVLPGPVGRLRSITIRSSDEIDLASHIAKGVLSTGLRIARHT